jgi:prepilin-type N-terminal cleavage/methylation domain-containing protein
MKRVGTEDGMTLIELIVAMSVSLLIFGATLSAFESVQSGHARNTEHNDAQDQVRRVTDRLARDLRNLASPTDFATSGVANAVEKNGRWDLIFKAVDNNIAGAPPVGNPAGLKRVRVCLDNTTRTSERIIVQEQTAAGYTAAPPAAAMSASAPCTTGDAGWTTARVAAANVVNRIDAGNERPVFSYAADGRQLAYNGGATVLQDVTRIETTIFVDPTPTRTPVESQLTSSVFLRNQNREPVASFYYTWVNKAARVVQLNGTASEDPEGETLQTFEFWDETTNTKLSSSAEYQWTMPDFSPHNVVLKVKDLAGLEGVSEPQTIDP